MAIAGASSGTGLPLYGSSRMGYRRRWR